MKVSSNITAKEKNTDKEQSRKTFRYVLIAVVVVFILWLTFAIWDSQTGGFNGPLPFKLDPSAIENYIKNL